MAIGCKSFISVLTRSLYFTPSRYFSRLSATSDRLGSLTTRRPTSEELEDPVSQEIASLWSLRKYYKDGDVKNSLLNDNRFRETCALVMKRLRYLRPEDVRSMAHLVLGINLPTNIGITKGILQMLRVHLNEYDAKQLADIYQLLSINRSFDRDPFELREPVNPVLEALLVAVPKVLEIKILRKQFISEKSEHLLTILKSAVAASIDIEPIRFLLQVIANKLRYIDVVYSNQLFGLLCHPHIESNLDLLGRPLIGQILNHCWNMILKSMADQNFEIDLCFNETLKLLSSTNDPIYYNPDFCDTVYDVYERSDSLENFDHLDYFLSFAMKYDHYSTSALDNIFHIICNNSQSFLFESPLTSGNIIQILGRLNWKPTSVDWTGLRSLLLEDIKLSGSSFYSPMETLISYLILKEHDAFEELAEIETPNLSIEIANRDKSMSFYENILTLNIGTSCEAVDPTPSSMKSMLSSCLMDAIDHLNSIDNSSLFKQSLSAFLRLSCGDSKTLVNNIWTSNGHLIDNLLMIDKHGRPVEFVQTNQNNINRKGPKFIEDYQIEDQSTLVAVIPLTDEDFCTKPYKLKGQMELRLRTLEENLGIKVLRIHLDTWECLSDREKCMFLLRDLGETIGQEMDKQLVDRVCY